MKKAFVIAGLAAGMMFSAPLMAQASAGALGVNVQAGAHVETVDYRRGPSEGGYRDRDRDRYRDRDYRDHRRHDRYDRRDDRRHDRYDRRDDRRDYYRTGPSHYRPFAYWRPRYERRYRHWGAPVYYAHHPRWGAAYRVRAYDDARDRAVILWISAITGAILLSQY